MKALVLLKFSSLETKDAYRLLGKLKPVIETHLLYGRYDAVAVIQAMDMGEIRQIIFSDIQPISGVVETMPCLIVEDEVLNLESNRTLFSQQ